MTLVELLAVITVISLLIGAAASIMRGPRQEISVRGAVDASAAVVEQASMVAKSRKTPTRLVVNVDPASRNFLRQLAVYYKDNTGNWTLGAGPHLLPQQIYFDEDSSEGYTPAQYSFNLATSQNGSTGEDVVAFEFDRNGHFIPPAGVDEPRMILVGGFVPEGGTDRALVTTERQRENRSGFLFRRYGYVTRYESPDQIPASSSSDPAAP